MRPLSSCSREEWRAVSGVLTDIDDTLTDDGALPPAALDALHRLQAARIPVIAITGRPAGWSEPFAISWPVQGIVAENGGVLLHREGEHLRTEFTQPDEMRAANAERLHRCAADILARVPGATLARDSAGRLTDIAIDHSEFSTLSDEAIAVVCDLMRSHGLTATVSSIHINGWIGHHSKWTAAHWAVQRLTGQAFDPAQWVYVGDSTNDQLMFERVPLSVGVANVRRFLPMLAHLPAYVTEGERGVGFAEVAVAMLAARDR
ncbi:HAD family hydrolase [Roseateles amylovorans]|uniref:HAD-IIB family hydrolase n=1 Tax=Roseateles amylovorans TaxID=2978473 RepID=A0ABY6B1I9_9BURK|nr:HAD-IIB family hydrolase [Roseateles amylovorans]UXH79028.1 HAD-IIB family hydrolase [Roseateles amylovorans]